MRIECRKIAIVSLFLLLPAFVEGQELLIQGESVIKNLEVNTDGRLHLLMDGRLCEYEGKQLVGDCFPIERKIDLIIPIKDEFYILVAKNSWFEVRNGAITHRDSIQEMITCAKLQNNRILLGTAGNGVFSYSLIDHQTVFLGLENEFINDLLIDGEEVYVALDQGIARWYAPDSSFKMHFIPAIIHHLASMDAGQILGFGADQTIYSLNKSLDLVSKHSISLLDIEQLAYSLNKVFLLTPEGCFEMDTSYQVIEIVRGKYQDLLALENNLLLAQENKLYSIDLTVRELRTSEEVLALFAEVGQGLWVGHVNKVLYYENHTFKYEVLLPTSIKNAAVSSIVVHDSILIVGTMGDGIFFLKREGNLIKHLKLESGDDKNNIIQLQILEDKLWAAYLNGLFTIDLKTFEIRELESASLDENYVYSFKIVAENEYYLGTSASGLLQYKNDQVNQFLPGSSIYSLYLSEEGLVIGTKENGVYLLQNDTLIKYIPDVSPRGIAGLDNLVLICQANQSDIYLGQTAIPLSNGNLKNAQLNCLSENKDELFIGFANGILCLNKTRMLGLKNIGLHLNQPYLFEDLIPRDKNLFSHDENSFTFSFHSNSYYQISNTIFKYRLLGLDSTWQSTQQNSVNYYNLTPGDYTFEVASSYSHLAVIHNKQHYKFRIEKPYWERAWFLSSMALMVFMTIIYLIKRRERLLVKKGNVEKEKMRFELEQLKNQINPHFLFNSFNSLIGLIEENPESAVQTTQLLSDLFRNILKYEKLDLIPLSQELALAESYFHIHKIRLENLLDLELDVKGESNGKLIPLSCQFLIENAIKHNIINSDNPMFISITREANYLIVSNSYHPKKINFNYSTGLGLKNLQARYHLLTNMPVHLEIKEQQFIVKLPIVND